MFTSSDGVQSITLRLSGRLRQRRRTCVSLRTGCCGCVLALATRRSTWLTDVVSTLFAIAGSSIGGWIGWAAGAHVGLMTGYLTSVVGSAAGVYYGRRVHAHLLDS